MGQTPEGARKAAATSKKLYGDDFHSKIGSKGGKAPTGAFATDRRLARSAGSKGGKARKGWRKKKEP